jgi:phosphoribosylamine--glycine ligase
MGAISPVPFAHDGFLQKVEEQVVKPTVNGLKEENFDYKGFIFIGLMNKGGDPYVIEYNVRMGDPETEAVLPRIDSDLMDLFEGVAQGNLAEKEFAITPQTAATVVMVSGGYPESYPKGKTITGLTNNAATVFHAGTKQENENVVTSGGRVLAVTGMGNSMGNALEQAFETVNNIQFDGSYHRTDIGKDLA